MNQKKYRAKNDMSNTVSLSNRRETDCSQTSVVNGVDVASAAAAVGAAAATAGPSTLGLVVDYGGQPRSICSSWLTI